MQEAIKVTQELVNERRDITIEEKQEHMNRLKPEINNLLHSFLPDDLTLKEIDILAMIINEMIWNPRRFLNANITKINELTCDSCGSHPNVLYTTGKGRFCEGCKPKY
jgi:hypothetical protein